MKRKKYEKELRRLQAQLCHLQAWVKHKGLRVVIVFEGRDAAGKGGTIKAITERVSPRVFRLVALPAPSVEAESLPSLVHPTTTALPKRNTRMATPFVPGLGRRLPAGHATRAYVRAGAYCGYGRYNGSPTHTIIHCDRSVLSYAASPNDAPDVRSRKN